MLGSAESLEEKNALKESSSLLETSWSFNDYQISDYQNNTMQGNSFITNNLEPVQEEINWFLNLNESEQQSPKLDLFAQTSDLTNQNISSYSIGQALDSNGMFSNAIQQHQQQQQQQTQQSPQPLQQDAHTSIDSSNSLNIMSSTFPSNENNLNFETNSISFDFSQQNQSSILPLESQFTNINLSSLCPSSMNNVPFTTVSAPLLAPSPSPATKPLAKRPMINTRKRRSHTVGTLSAPPISTIPKSSYQIPCVGEIMNPNLSSLQTNLNIQLDWNSANLGNPSLNFDTSSAVNTQTNLSLPAQQNPTSFRRPRAATLPGSQPIPTLLNVNTRTSNSPLHSTSSAGVKRNQNFSDVIHPKVDISTRRRSWQDLGTDSPLSATPSPHPFQSSLSIENKSSTPPVPIPSNRRDNLLSKAEQWRKLDEELKATDFEDITVMELKDLLKNRSLPSSGKKAVLMERLQEELKKAEIRAASNYDERIFSIALLGQSVSQLDLCQGGDDGMSSSLSSSMPPHTPPDHVVPQFTNDSHNPVNQSHPNTNSNNNNSNNSNSTSNNNSGNYGNDNNHYPSPNSLSTSPITISISPDSSPSSSNSDQPNQLQQSTLNLQRGRYRSFSDSRVSLPHFIEMKRIETANLQHSPLTPMPSLLMVPQNMSMHSSSLIENNRMRSNSMSTHGSAPAVNPFPLDNTSSIPPWFNISDAMLIPTTDGIKNFFFPFSFYFSFVFIFCIQIFPLISLHIYCLNLFFPHTQLHRYNSHVRFHALKA